MIVVPSYSVDLWAVYLKQFCPGLKTVTFSPNKKALFHLNDQVLEDHFNICLTSYQNASKFNSHLRRIRWESIVFDGTHKIKELKNDIILSSFSFLPVEAIYRKLDKAESSACKAFVFPTFVYAPPMLPHVSKIVDGGSLSKAKAGKNSGDLVSATTYSVDNIASNNVTYTMIKCKLSEFQLRRYNLEKKRQKQDLESQREERKAGISTASTLRITLRRKSCDTATQG